MAEVVLANYVAFEIVCGWQIYRLCRGILLQFSKAESN